MGQFLGAETDRIGQFLGPETDIMGERYYIKNRGTLEIYKTFISDFVVF